jgi:hypothetical protein
VFRQIFWFDFISIFYFNDIWCDRFHFFALILIFSIRHIGLLISATLRPSAFYSHDYIIISYWCWFWFYLFRFALTFLEPGPIGYFVSLAAMSWPLKFLAPLATLCYYWFRYIWKAADFKIQGSLATARSFLTLLISRFLLTIHYTFRLHFVHAQYLYNAVPFLQSTTRIYLLAISYRLILIDFRLMMLFAISRHYFDDFAAGRHYYFDFFRLLLLKRIWISLMSNTIIDYSSFHALITAPPWLISRANFDVETLAALCMRHATLSFKMQWAFDLFSRPNAPCLRPISRYFVSRHFKWALYCLWSLPTILI